MITFADQAIIEVYAGKGGAGSVSFRREKYIPRGGPDGGDGGKGGDVIIQVSRQKKTLLDFRYKKVFKAGNGKPGGKAKCTGADGKNCFIPVPAGTMVFNHETGELLVDLTKPEQSYVLAKGGRGGKGNAHFATATHQTPRFAQPGESGQSMTSRLDLKLIADVGLAGFPNAGKSTFISVVSNAKPKIADYPFTTLTPNLGVVHRGDGREFIIADIPGIIEGSHEGKGIGDQFLRHIERTAIVLLMIDVSIQAVPEPEKAIPLLLNELEKFNPDLLPRISALVATKTDVASDLTGKNRIQTLRAMADQNNWSFFDISSVTSKNIEALLNNIETVISKHNTSNEGDQA